MDYDKLGFKAGLEIHQQLDTKHKLFSFAPTYLRSDKPDYIIKRRLHAVAGESGEVDAAVAYEATLGKEFSYECYRDTTSLVELDEEPPHMINHEALKIVLQVALLLNCEIYPITQIMRKLVIDGSNTSGFQRTVLVAHDGYIETSFGKVPVETIALEEDSARIISKSKDSAVYRLDRLGIPLIEIATAPIMKHPEEVKEAALKIGEILRACKVKRGIGTIRQDVNISIKGHEKVEIKGFQDPAMMVMTINKEIERQMQDIKEKKTEGAVRNALPSGDTEFLRPLPGKARMYPETDLPLLTISRDLENSIRKNLPKLRSELKQELKKKGLSDEMINLILDEGANEFLTLIKVHKKDANLIAKMIALWPSEFATKLKSSIEEVRTILTERVLEEVLELVDEGKLESGDVKTVLGKILEGVPFEHAVKVEKIDHDALEEEISKIIKEKPGLRANAYMGLVMAKYKGKIDAKRAMELIERALK